MIQISQSHYSSKNLSDIEEAFTKLLARQDLGYLKLPHNIAMAQACMARKQELQGVETLCMVGTGGSSFGGKVLCEVFDIQNVRYFENVDAWGFEKQLQSVGDLKKTHWVFVSKSGGTIEVLTQLNFIHQHYKKQKLDLTKNCTVITEIKDSPLYNWAQENQIPVIGAPLDVGGRFSVLSPAGLFPAVFSGVKALELLEGARWTLDQKQLVTEFVGQILQSWDDDKWITVFWSYCDFLNNFNGWTQQLWAESLAKKVSLLGEIAPRVSTPMGMMGTVDQHSLLQQVMEGSRDKFLCFLRVESSEICGEVLEEPIFGKTENLAGKSMGALLKAEALATQGATAEMGVPSLTLVLKSLDEKSTGALLMLMQLVVGTLGEILNIDAYDQPGVELGKKLTMEYLKKNK